MLDRDAAVAQGGERALKALHFKDNERLRALSATGRSRYAQSSTAHVEERLLESGRDPLSLGKPKPSLLP